MPTIRSFIAIELSDHARTELTRLQERLKDIMPAVSVRWGIPKNIHLTLHFLGDLSIDHLETVSRTVRDVATTIPSFSLSLGNLGCFPNTRRPRIVWVSVSGETEILVRLHRELGNQLQKRIGFKPEARPYSPHLTIGRVKKGIPQQRLREMGQILEQEIPRAGELAVLPVHHILFIRSDLKPVGPIYTSLTKAHLAQAS